MCLTAIPSSAFSKFHHPVSLSLHLVCASIPRNHGHFLDAICALSPFSRHYLRLVVKSLALFALRHSSTLPALCCQSPYTLCASLYYLAVVTQRILNSFCCFLCRAHQFATRCQFASELRSESKFV